MARNVLRLAAENDRALPRRVNFTDAGVRRITCPPDKARIRVYDEKVPGLTLSVRPSGSRAFYWYGRVRAEPRPVEYLIGDVEKISVSYARDEAKRINADATKGISPAVALAAAKSKARQSRTVEQIWTAYRDEHLKPNCGTHTVVTDESRYALYLKPWAGRRVSDITKDDVVELHRAITQKQVAANKSGNAADKAVKLLRRMLTWAKVPENPASRAVAFHGDRKLQRFLSVDELARLTIALANAANTTIADALRFALLTGARKGNVRRARWRDVHLDQAVWTIPADESKNGEAMTIPLAPAAVKLLKDRKALAKDSQWVFPGRVADQPISELKTTWDKIRAAAKVPDCRIHDLRHTLASWMAMSGASLPTIGKQLGHASQQSTARYSHLDLDAVRPLTSAAVALMFGEKPAETNAGASGENGTTTKTAKPKRKRKKPTE